VFKLAAAAPTALARSDVIRWVIPVSAADALAAISVSHRYFSSTMSYSGFLRMLSTYISVNSLFCLIKDFIWIRSGFRD